LWWKRGTGTGFSPSSSVSPVNIIPLETILIYHLGDEQYSLRWPQFRDKASPHRYEQQQQQQLIIYILNYES
jgi:hypothetical protein